MKVTLTVFRLPDGSYQAPYVGTDADAALAAMKSAPAGTHAAVFRNAQPFRRWHVEAPAASQVAAVKSVKRK